MQAKLFTRALFIIILGASLGINPGAHLYEKDTIAPADSTITVSISAVGDLMCHIPQTDFAKVSRDSFDFSTTFSVIKKYWRSSDLILGNLETVTAGEKAGYSGYPTFNSPDEFIQALKLSGFNLITTANNHALDKGTKGALRTIEVLRRNEINYDGTFTSQQDRDSIRIYNLKGIKLAVLAYTYGVNGNYIPSSYKYIINIIDTLQIKSDIKSARNKGVEIVLVYLHFGDQYKREANADQKEIVKKTISYGADIILGGHPHVLEPLEYYKTNNARLDTGFVIYSLGNFISNQMWRYSDAGVVLTINLTKRMKDNSIFISSVDAVPTFVFKGNTGKENQFLILPAEAYQDSSYKFLSREDVLNMKQADEDTRKIFTKHTKNLNFIR